MKNKNNRYTGQPTLDEWKAYRELQNEPFDFGDGLIYNDSIVSDDATYKNEIQNLENEKFNKNMRCEIKDNNYLKSKRRKRVKNNRKHKLHEFKFNACDGMDLCYFGVKILKYNGIFLPSYSKSFDYLDNMDLEILRHMIIKVFKLNNIRYISLSSLNVWDLLDVALFCAKHKLKNKKYKRNARDDYKKLLSKKIRHHKIEDKISDGCEYKRLYGYLSDELYFYSYY